MLWRFLLAVAVVSCTLTRTHAHGPKDRLKDLMCVLLLSGMQKEDLDVNMLNKLQRYNVNIQDTNNEDLLQECMELRNNSSRDIINKTLTNASGVFDGVLQENEYSQQKQSNPAHPDKTPMQIDNIKQEIKNDTIQYFDGKPKLGSVLKFWQDMTLKKETTDSPKSNNDNFNTNRKYISEPMKKRNIQENSDSNEEDDIKKLLESYFSKKQHNKKIKHPNKETTTTTTTRRNIDNIYKELLESRMENKNDNFGIGIPNIFQLDRRENDKGHMRLLPIEDMRPYNGNFSQILSSFRRFSPNNQENNKYSKDTKILSDNPYFRNYQETERKVSTTEKETPQRISNDMINEIAKSVKEIVMRDLKLHIQETGTSSIPATTIRITKTILPSQMDNSLKIQESIMKKFLEMFEEIKTLKKNAIQISSNNINKQKVEQELPKTLIQETINRMDVSKQMLLYNNPYQVQHPKTNSQNLNFLPQEHKFRANEVQVTVNTSPNPFIPIMFQTNNLEIPPLGIPIDKQLNPINQNIIVTSEVPYRIGVIKNILRPKNNPFSELEKFEENIPKQNHISKSRDSDFNVPTRYDVRFTSNKAPKHHQSYYDKIRLSNYRPRSDNVEYIKPPEVPRFHERLENIDFLDIPDKKRYTDRIDCCNEKYAYSKQMVECCGRKIASRQQMSLNNMKKGSYDDTHFKNFLKTQQKVTDMLERILSTRDTVRSVETT